MYFSLPLVRRLVVTVRFEADRKAMPGRMEIKSGRGVRMGDVVRVVRRLINERREEERDGADGLGSGTRLDLGEEGSRNISRPQTGGGKLGDRVVKEHGEK
jgi:hypothetical protein